MDHDQAKRILRSFGLQPGDPVPAAMRSKPQAFRHVRDALALLAPVELEVPEEPKAPKKTPKAKAEPKAKAAPKTPAKRARKAKE